MAVPEPIHQKNHLAHRESTIAKHRGPEHEEPSRLESTIIDLYVRGLTRRKIARLLVDHLAMPREGESVNGRLKRATRRLRHLEGRKWFRDLLWERAMIAADMRTPNIMAGVVRKAEEGRVDAAKLALSITGRYTEQGDVQATQVNIVFGADIPRPARHGIEGQSAAEDVEDAEWEDAS
jgi:hypothetical protein